MPIPVFALAAAGTLGLLALSGGKKTSASAPAGGPGPVALPDPVQSQISKLLAGKDVKAMLAYADLIASKYPFAAEQLRAAASAISNGLPPPPNGTPPAPVSSAGTAGNPTIKQGSTGEAVKTWQKILGVTVDGIFGSGTAYATRLWQAAHKLTADGIVGPATWAAAALDPKPVVSPSSPILVAPPLPKVTTPVATPPQTVSIQPVKYAPGSLAGSHATIRQGSRGVDVATWQAFLGITADGIFGSQTTAATKTFQASKKLTADGIVGPATWAAARGEIPSATPSVTPALPALPAPKVTAPADPLLIRQGSTGPVVKSWQRILGLTEDGIFGSQTTAATKKWQTAHGLPADGIVGPKTWAAASAPTSAAPSPLQVSVGPATNITPVATSNASISSAYLREGSRGDAVKSWQKILGITEDGIFGPNTTALTKRWQTAHGLPADGIVGPATMAAAAKDVMVAPLLTSTSTTAAPIPLVSPAGQPTIKKGSTGPAVKAWQTILGVTADGIFGSGTESATKKWQAARGLTADGIVGPKSWAAATSTTVSGLPMLATVHRPTLRVGSTGVAVQVWQKILGLRTDGKFGIATAAATKRWQQARGLRADGVVGPSTWAAATSHRVSGSYQEEDLVGHEPQGDIEKQDYDIGGYSDPDAELRAKVMQVTDPTKLDAVALLLVGKRGKEGLLQFVLQRSHELRSALTTAGAIQTVHAILNPGSTPPAAPHLSATPTVGAETPMSDLQLKTAAIAKHIHGTRRGREDRMAIKNWQTSAGIPNATGDFDPRSAERMAELGVSNLPVILYWPKRPAPQERLQTYRMRLLELAKQAEQGGNTHRATELRDSARRERGQRKQAGA